MSTVTANVEPSPFVNVISFRSTEAVSNEDAVIELCTNPKSLICVEPDTTPDGKDSLT